MTTNKTKRLKAWLKTPRGKKVKRLTLVVIAGLAVGLLCPELPIEYRAPCRLLVKLAFP